MTNKSILIHRNSDPKKLRELIDTARARLAAMEAAYTIEKSKVELLQARLFEQLRPLRQERDRLRILVDYRRQFFSGLLRGDEEEAERARDAHREAEKRNERDYEETAQALASKKELTPQAHRRHQSRQG
jgi:hypothetical protein